jgi:hypothetical protein
MSKLVKTNTIPRLYEDTVATFLRIGATNTMVSHPSISLADSNKRGGWGNSGICNVWDESIGIAGCPLAGYTNIRLKCF